MSEEYEILEPDPEDEYYDELCGFMYAQMFNRGVNYDSSIRNDCAEEENNRSCAVQN